MLLSLSKWSQKAWGHVGNMLSGSGVKSGLCTALQAAPCTLLLTRSMCQGSHISVKCLDNYTGPTLPYSSSIPCSTEAVSTIYQIALLAGPRQYWLPQARLVAQHGPYRGSA